MISDIALILMIFAAGVPFSNKYLKAKINVKYHFYLAYAAITAAIIALIMNLI